jgi:membrane protein
MRLSALPGLFKTTLNQWLEHKPMRLAAALAYYTTFSLAPLMLLTVGITGFVFGEQAARGQLASQLTNVLGEAGAKAVQDLLSQAHQSGSSLLATLIGLAVWVFGASGVFVELQDCLDTIWEVTTKPGRGLTGAIKDRFWSFVMVLCIGLLLLAALLVSTALALLSHFLVGVGLPGGASIWPTSNFLVSFALITVLFAMMYKILPDVKIAWSDVWLGAAVTALLFTLGKYLISLYLSYSGAASAFGAAGSVVLILLWVYYSSLIFLFGAEFTRVYADQFGSRVKPADNAVALTATDRTRQGLPASSKARICKCD